MTDEKAGAGLMVNDFHGSTRAFRQKKQRPAATRSIPPYWSVSADYLPSGANTRPGRQRPLGLAITRDQLGGLLVSAGTATMPR